MVVSAQTLIDQIRRGNRSGATRLTHQAGEVLLAWLREAHDVKSLEATRASLQQFAFNLIRAKPTMASITHLVSQALFAADEATSKADLNERVRATVPRFIERLEQSTAQIAVEAAKLIDSGMTVVTISDSATAFAAFRQALSAEKRFTVICPESRPIGEGVALARELARLGLTVELVTDAMAPGLVRRCDLVLVGGDALAPEGLCNKIGSYALALAARMSLRPFTALVGEQKHLPRFSETLIPHEPPEELLSDRDLPKNLRIENRYFELVPLELLTEIISESGPVQPKELLKRLQAIRLHPILAAS